MYQHLRARVSCLTCNFAQVSNAPHLTTSRDQRQNAAPYLASGTDNRPLKFPECLGCIFRVSSCLCVTLSPCTLRSMLQVKLGHRQRFASIPICMKMTSGVWRFPFVDNVRFYGISQLSRFGSVALLPKAGDSICGILVIEITTKTGKLP